jgi:hypothetical protein
MIDADPWVPARAIRDVLRCASPLSRSPVLAIEGILTGTPSIRRHFVRVSKTAVSKKIVSAANWQFLIFHTSNTSPLAVLPFGKA